MSATNRTAPAASTTATGRGGPASVGQTSVVLAAGTGAVLYALSIGTGELLDRVGDGSQTAGEWVATAGIALVGAAVAVLLGRRAVRHGEPALRRTALGLAVVAALAFVVFWAG